MTEDEGASEDKGMPTTEAHVEDEDLIPAGAEPATDALHFEGRTTIGVGRKEDEQPASI